MNKKIIAIAIASAMAAPAAMADLKISGRMAGHLTQTTTTGSASSREFGDQGQARIQFDATVGNAFARMAWDARPTTTGGPWKGQREQYAGYKLGGGALAFGRVTGAAKNLESDPYIATFLQIRNTHAEARTAKEYGSSSFVSNLVEFRGKAGAVKYTIQYDPTNNTATSGNEGHTALGVSGKAGAVNWWASYNNGTANDSTASESNTKIGASMKFGSVKATLNLSSANDGTNNWTATTLWADMNLGGGLSANAGFATTTGAAAKEGSWLRLAIAKKLNKGTTFYGGYVADTTKSTSSTTSQIGVGLTVKF